MLTVVSPLSRQLLHQGVDLPCLGAGSDARGVLIRAWLQQQCLCSHPTGQVGTLHCPSASSPGEKILGYLQRVQCSRSCQRIRGGLLVSGPGWTHRRTPLQAPSQLSRHQPVVQQPGPHHRRASGTWQKPFMSPRVEVSTWIITRQHISVPCD